MLEGTGSPPLPLETVPAFPKLAFHQVVDVDPWPVGNSPQLAALDITGRVWLFDDSVDAVDSASHPRDRRCRAAWKARWRKSPDLQPGLRPCVSQAAVSLPEFQPPRRRLGTEPGFPLHGCVGEWSTTALRSRQRTCHRRMAIQRSQRLRPEIRSRWHALHFFRRRRCTRRSKQCRAIDGQPVELDFTYRREQQFR